MRIQSIVIVLIGYFGYLSLLIFPLVQNTTLKKCIKSGLIDYEYLKLRIEAQRGSSKYSADINFENKKYYLTLQKAQYEKAKKGEKIEIYYCKIIDEVFTDKSIWSNNRVSLLAFFLIIFWTAMLKWVFIPYEKKKKSVL